MVDIPRTYKGRYQEASYVAKGGFGSVFKAIDLSNPERPVAVKRVIEEPGNPQSPGKRQIEQEVLLLQKNAPNFPFIPNFFDYWSEKIHAHLVHHYIVMEYIEGATLDKLRPLPWTSDAVNGFLQALLGYLQQLHDVGIVHRDIKPLNIKKPDHTYVILDFGISTQHSHTQIHAYSPDFAAPEQIYDQRRSDVHVDARTDLYCLAATAFYLLTDTKPTKAELRLANVKMEFPEHFQQAPPALQETLLEMLALDMDKRPSSARDALGRLRSRLSGPAQSPVLPASEALPVAKPAPDVFMATTEDAYDNAKQLHEAKPTSAIPQEPPPAQVNQDLSVVMPTLAPLQQATEEVVETDIQGKGKIKDIAWSPDGQELAITTILGVYLYKLSGAEQQIRGVGSPHVGFALQGEAIGLAANNSVQFWSRDRQIQMTTPPILSYPDDAPGTVIFAPDGAALAVVTEHDIILWQVRETHVTRLTTLSEYLVSPGASSKGATLIANTNNDAARLHAAISAGIDPSNVALSSDGQVLFATWNDTVILWRPSTTGSPLLYVMHDVPVPVVSVALAPDGEALAVASDGAWKVWNRYGRQVRAYAEKLPLIRCPALDAGGQHLALVEEESIHIRQVRSKELMRTLPGRTTGVFKVMFDQSGRHIAAAAPDRVWIWEIDNGREPREIPFSEGVERVVFAPDGKVLATAGRSLRLWNVNGKLSVKSVFAGDLDQPRIIAIDPKGKMLAAASRDQIIMWPVEAAPKNTRQALQPIPSGAANASAIAFANNGQQIVNFTGEKVETWRIKDTSLLLSWELPGVHNVTFTQDGQLMATCSAQTIYIRRTRDGALQEGGTINTRVEINCIALAPDGTTLAVASNQTIRIWSLSKKEWVAEQQARAEHLAFAPNGKMLASVNRTSVQLWRLREGHLEILGAMQGHCGAITDVAFGRSEDDWCEFASASRDGTLRLWKYSKQANGEDGPKPAPEPSSLRPLKIFLCYDARNKVRVGNLYGRLEESGFLPWMARKDLKGGQDWAKVIEEQVRISDVVIICVSRQFVANDSFAKKEMNYALGIARKKPKDSIFIIPVKLEECNIPPELGDRHYVKYFEKGGYEELHDALQQRAVNLSNILDDSLDPSTQANILDDRPSPGNLGNTVDSRVDSLPDDVKATHTRLIYLFEILTQNFNGSELREIYFYLGIDYESLSGENIRDKARELVLYCQRLSIIAKLEQLMRRFRPGTFGQP